MRPPAMLAPGIPPHVRIYAQRTPERLTDRRLTTAGLYADEGAAKPAPAQAAWITAQSVRAGFTLLEMLIVLGIIAILLALLASAVTSLSKSGGRRAARDRLLGGIEQARAEAITSGQSAYIVFPTFTSGTQPTLDRYNYRSYAVFEDNAASPGNVRRLTDWKSFPAGVALRAAGTAALSINLAPTASPTPSVSPPPFSFTPDSNATVVYQY